MGNGSPALFHASNLLMLALLGWVVVVRGRLPSDGARWVALGVVLLHPMQVEVACNITARTDLLAALFGTLAMTSLGPAGAVWTALALGSKEVAVIIPLLAWLWNRGSGPRGWLPHLVVVAVWAVVRTMLLAGWEVSPDDRGLPTAESIREAPARVLLYLGRLIVPIPPVAARAIEPIEPAMALAAWLALAGVIWIGWRKLGSQRVSGALLLLPLIPVSGLLASPVRYAEGFLAWPLVGMAWILAGTRALRMLSVVVLPLWLLVTVPQVSVWRNEESLWLTAHSRYPADPLIAQKLARRWVWEHPRAALKLSETALAGEHNPRRKRKIHAVMAASLIELDAPWTDIAPHLHKATADLDDPAQSWSIAQLCILGTKFGDPAAEPACDEAARRDPDTFRRPAPPGGLGR